jgi:hypothetical protein
MTNAPGGAPRLLLADNGPAIFALMIPIVGIVFTKVAEDAKFDG